MRNALITAEISQLRGMLLAQGQQPNPGLSPQVSKDGARRVRDELQRGLPQFYLFFLLQMNGFDWDGLSLYYLRDICSPQAELRQINDDNELVACNMYWRNSRRGKHLSLEQDGLILGEDELFVIVYTATSQTFCLFDDETLVPLERYASFGELLRGLINLKAQTGEAGKGRLPLR